MGVLQNMHLPECALSVRFERNLFHTWVVICHYGVSQRIIKRMYPMPLVSKTNEILL